MKNAQADAMKCPVAHGFDPFAADYVADPYSIFDALRRQGAVVYSPQYDAYVVTHYAEIAQVLEDNKSYSSANTTDPITPLCDEAKSILNDGFPRLPTFTNCDPPRHLKMRNAASVCLTPRRWAKSQPEIRVFAEELIDRIAQEPVSDLVEDLAFPLPAFAGFRLLGFPPKDTDMLKNWCGHRALLTYGQLGKDDQIAAAHQLVEFWNYVRDFVCMRETDPGDDLTSDLLELSRKRGDDLTREDVINMVYSISLASHETTTTAMANGLYSLLSDRAAWNAVCADTSLIPNAVEELLRFNSPTMVLRRRTTCDVELAGVDIPAGATVMLVLASGHHDSQHFAAPDKLNITRDNAKDHLAFGRKWHLCLGAPLARFELNLVLDLLARKLPNMRLVADAKIHIVPTILIRGPEKLLVEPAPAA